MMKILVPIPAEKRLPGIANNNVLNLSSPVIVRYVNPNISESFSALTFAYYDHDDKYWQNTLTIVKNDDHSLENKDNKVIEWYEEIELESLFPDDEKSYNAAKAATNGSSFKTFIHQEGQSFFKNHIIRTLRK